MNVSLQHTANDPPTYAMRVHPNGGSWQQRSKYDGTAQIQMFGAIATIQAFVGQHTREVRDAILDAIRPYGVLALIGTRGEEDRLMIWIVP